MSSDKNALYFVIKYEEKYYSPYISDDVIAMSRDIHNMLSSDRYLAVRFSTRELAEQMLRADAMARSYYDSNFDVKKARVVRVVKKLIS